MKKSLFRVIVMLLFLAVALPLRAADTGQINYQARLLDSYGRRVNGAVDLSFKIYDAATGGNLLWSETQAGVTVQDGVYSVILGSQTPVPASVFAVNNVYLELGINGETLLPRQQMTASSYALTARTIMGSNVYENQTSGNLGVGTTNPVEKLDVNGTIRTAGFKMPTGAASDYILVSDGNGVGTWQSFSVVVVESDPHFTNWVNATFAPVTNDLWTAVNARVLAVTFNAATGDLWNAVGNLNASTGALNTAVGNLNTATGALNTAVGTKVNRAGDVMTGSLTNNAGFYGNGAGLTNVPSGGVILTGYVQKVGDTMSGALIVSNNLTVAFTNQAADFVATNSISLRGTVITNWENLTGTLNTAVANLNTSTGTLNTAVSSLNTSTGTLNTAVANLNTSTGTLNTAVANLNTSTGTLNTAVANLNTSTATLNTAVGNLNTATNALNARAVQWDKAVICKQGSGPAGNDTIAYSNLYYLGGGTVWSNANAVTNVTAKGLLGLGLGSSMANNGLLLNGMFSNQWGFAIGSVIYMDTNANQITTSAPDGTNNVVRILGYAVSATNIYFNPDRTYIEILGQ